METPWRNHMARFVTGLAWPAAPDDARHQVKRCLLDFLGVALGAGDLGLVPAVRGILGSLGGTPQAGVIGEKLGLPVTQATLLNGVKGHALDMDDGHRRAASHPAVVVFPALLAAAEMEDRAGERLLEAALAGYEVLIHLGLLMNPAHLNQGFHSTAALGAFGAAAAVAKVLGLDQARTAEALALAGLAGGGLLEVLASGQMAKPWQTARASQAGLWAALLARQGGQGPELILEGPRGFVRAYGQPAPDPGVLAGLGRKFEITKVYFKVHAACRHVHCALDAALDLVHGQDLDPGEITGITVGTYRVAHELTGANRRAATPLAAKFSLPVALALCLLQGRTGQGLFAAADLDDPAVHALADLVRVEVDPAKEAAYPGQRGAWVRVETGRGVFSCDYALPRGEPETPLTDQELAGKFAENAEPVLGPAGVAKVTDLVWNLERSTARQLMAALRTN
ncbi:MAG: MmgE/PrpD family protein [Deltaproteobacteria bacterium]|nr:MmgE/PrpD family protein [Deltaproteobacteria bacterium]